MTILKLYGKNDERSWLSLARALANATGMIWVVYHDGTRYHMGTDTQIGPIDKRLVTAICVPDVPKCMRKQPPFQKDVG